MSSTASADALDDLEGLVDTEPVVGYKARGFMAKAGEARGRRPSQSLKLARAYLLINYRATRALMYSNKGKLEHIHMSKNAEGRGN
jgi:hypothetical protein